ncbi:MAG: protein TolR [Alphaproteobacteria bacterium]|nr:protein TolR [Alphaproteobacteria bacterium]MDD9920518.1 protein TolR [Alphaproteobacteria bacterium]
MAGGLLPGGRNARFSYRRPPMHDINVTPFVDVMLVLLVVFMITAPMMTQGVDVSLPEVETNPMSDSAEPLTVSLKANGEIYLEARQVNLGNLPARLKAITKVRDKTMILVRADKRVPYGQVMNVMASLQEAGLVNVGLVTEPPK